MGGLQQQGEGGRGPFQEEVIFKLRPKSVRARCSWEGKWLSWAQMSGPTKVKRWVEESPSLTPPPTPNLWSSRGSEPHLLPRTPSPHKPMYGQP